MKQFSVILFLFCNTLIFAQNGTDFNREYSVNAGAMLNGLLDLGGSPYQLAIRKLGEKTNKRLGFGVNLNGRFTTSNDDFDGGLAGNFRIGKERFDDFGKKSQWRFFYGGDFISGLQFQTVLERSVVTVRGGFAPIAGLRYKINDRLVLYTELSYPIQLSVQSTEGNTVISLNSSFSAPRTIWVGYNLFKAKSE